MEFKKGMNKVEAFIDGADEQNKEQKDKKSNKQWIPTKLTKEVSVKIRKKYPSYTLAKFIELSLITQIPHIKDEILVTIYDQAKWHNTSMGEYVRFKMGLIETPEPLNKKEVTHIKSYVIPTTKEKKEKIRQIAQDLEISTLMYSNIKIHATYELKDIFTFDELMQFKAEALNYGLELDEYIAMRIRG